jgi:hypothetical protein
MDSPSLAFFGAIVGVLFCVPILILFMVHRIGVKRDARASALEERISRLDVIVEHFRAEHLRLREDFLIAHPHPSEVVEVFVSPTAPASQCMRVVRLKKKESNKDGTSS